ncbi:Mitochondrial substrate/solute carrier [Trinorchestia longiramus]|nr:Mitochondrial substrate/solute carrier [Trinorchestia longiramus]
MSSNSNSLFSYNSLVHALAGGCSSAFAMSVFFPLDTIRTRLQLQKKLCDQSNDRRRASISDDESVLGMLQLILHEEGGAGLYRGLVPVIQSLYCSNFVYFYSFHGLKKALNPSKSALNDLLCGMAAGIINVMATTPLWVVNTRLKLQGTGLQLGEDKQYKGMIDGLLRLFREEGLTGLWAGCTSSLMLVINPAIQFMTYEAMKRHLTQGRNDVTPSSLLVFLTGAAAKAVATTVTYPLQLVQARQRHGDERGGVLKLLLAILRQDGPGGLFRGVKAKLLQTVLTAALMFVCYEKIAEVVFTVMMGRRRLAAHKL